MSQQKFNPIIHVDDDGLLTPEVGEWSEKKYRLHGAYCDIFTTSMKAKWNHLVYIDLFASSGYSKIRNSKKIIKSSSMIALSIPNTFTEYIFCEKDRELCHALRSRVKRDYPDKKVTIIEGDCNEKIDEIISSMPKYSKGNSVLSFCFVDPFSLNLSFKTIEKLGMFAMDFLILLALGMDANRNIEYYLSPGNNKVSFFLNDSKWREKYSKEHDDDHTSFMQFLAKRYREKILNLDYKEPEDFHEIRSTDKNLPLYHLAFFSKHSRGNEFWKKAQPYADHQHKLF